MRVRTMAWTVAAVILLTAGAAGAKDAGWIWDLSGKGNFFDLAFPTELRRADNGSINVADFPNPTHMAMIARTKEAVARGYGYSTGTTIYFHFNAGVNQNFPEPKASMAADSPLFLIDVDPASPERGRRFPVLAHFYPHGPGYMKFSNNLLAIMPVPGFVLRENTLYAAGVCRSLGDSSGKRLAGSAALAEIAAGNSPPGALGGKALAAYGPAIEQLARLKVKADDLAALTVFRTGDPTWRMQALFNGVKDNYDYEWEVPLHKTREYPLYTVLEGVVLLPQFQDGTPPYGHGKGGRIHFDTVGKPVVQRMDRVPVAFSIPKSKMPAAGFPITLFIHGTAGVSTQFIDRGETREDSPKAKAHGISAIVAGGAQIPEAGAGPALIFARRGIAGVGAAQQHAAERGGMPEQLWWYNFLSPEALRDNMLQGAAEASMLTRIIEEIKIDPSLCPEAETGGGPIHFNPQLIFGMGQSLGSLLLGPWGAVETDVKVLIPSGNGAYWSLFMAEGNAADLKSLQKRRWGQGKILHLDRFHPVITLMANVLAEGDPFAYQECYYRRPLPGRRPKHVWASFGILDNYFFPPTQNAAMIDMGLDLVGPALDPSTEPMLDLAGLKHLEAPVSGNKWTPFGPLTAVALRFEEVGPINGHHVNFQRNDAKYQYGCFLESMVRDGIPTLYPPKDQWDAPCGK